MGIVQQVIDRLAADAATTGLRTVEALSGLAGLMRAGQLPQVTPAAFVMPGGLTGGAVADMAGVHRQMLSRVVSVVLVLRDNDPAGAKAMTRADDTISAVIARLAGWQPDEADEALVFTRARLASSAAGAFIYQIDFTTIDQLRITL